MNQQANSSSEVSTSFCKYIARLKVKDSFLFLMCFSRHERRAQKKCILIPRPVSAVPPVWPNRLFQRARWYIHPKQALAVPLSNRKHMKALRAGLHYFSSGFLFGLASCSGKEHWLFNEQFKIIGRNSQVKNSMTLVSLMHQVLSIPTSLHAGYLRWIRFWHRYYLNNNNGA